MTKTSAYFQILLLVQIFSLDDRVRRVNEKVLVVLTDVMGNVVYSKINFSDESGYFADQVSNRT